MSVTTHFGNYDPASFGWKIPGSYTPYKYNGFEFPQGVASPSVGKLFDKILDVVVPRIPGGLVAGWNWGGENRDIAGSGIKSFHAYGIALDLNAPANPHHTQWGGGQHTLPSNTGILVRPFGAEWGGNWSQASIDRMHIELHLSPADVDAMIKSNPSGPSNSYSTYLHVSAGTRTVMNGSAGDDVKNLQDVLNQWYPSRKALVTDGYYGPNTTATVQYFQKRAKLAVDGITGRNTWKGLGFNVRY